ncbi:MAG: hydrogenase maturation protease [Phormidesmis sp. RL_2_1]|nr:hydrogenase maturation protease [Phormidesmis sp. RL_2_1]
MRSTPTLKAVAQSRFLIIGYGDELKGDEAVGPQVANTVGDWQLPAVKTMSVPQLTPQLVNDIVVTDYAIFVAACSTQSYARTVQLDPIVIGGTLPNRLLPAALTNTHDCNALTLLNLTHQLYGRIPQAWLLQVPTEQFDFGKSLSATAQRGCDRAVRTIEQFFKTYQQPDWMNQSIFAKSA